MTCYYEWNCEGNGSKTPWRFSLLCPSPRQKAPISEAKTDLFGLAGLFTFDHKIRQCRFAIVTIETSALTAEVGDRKPVTLNDMTMKVWLSPHSSR